MTESDFNQHIEDTLIAIEEAIEESGAEIDFETSGGVLTLSFANGSKVIVNAQTPLQQLWVAAKSGGFHFNYDATEGAWKLLNDGEELFARLSRVCSEQAGVPVSFV